MQVFFGIFIEKYFVYLYCFYNFAKWFVVQTVFDNTT